MLKLIGNIPIGKHIFHIKNINFFFDKINKKKLDVEY